jgi:hypothetical protein
MLKKINPKHKGSIHIYTGDNFEVDIKFHFYFTGKIFLILNSKEDFEIKVSHIFSAFHKIKKNKKFHQVYQVLCSSGEVFWINSYYLVNI